MSNDEESKRIDIVVVGSCNMDLISYLKHLPKPGETLKGNKYEIGFGGKGANQCVAAAKLGAKTAMVGKVGKDENGKTYLENFKKNYVNTENVLQVEDATTGVASIFVDCKGRNCIVIIPGANDKLMPCEVEKALKKFKSAKVLICQMEILTKTTLHALKTAKSLGMTTIFNPAPAPTEPLDPEFFKVCDVICPNEAEAESMCGFKVNDIESGKKAAKWFTKQGTKIAIVTLGKNGCVCLEKGKGEAFHVQPEPIKKVVDTTGAGDSFAGSLAYYMARFDKLPLEDKLARACQIASVSVQRAGSQKSYPICKELPKELFKK